MADSTTDEQAMAADNATEGAQPEQDNKRISKKRIREAFEETHAYNCLECGKCSGICPVTLVNTGFSPRIVVKQALLEFEDELCADANIWECLNCGLCIVRCRSDVNLSEFIRRLRIESKKIDNEYLCTHNNVFKLIPRMQLKMGERQDRLSWLTDDIKYKTEGEVLFFVGCAPYHEVMFREKGQDNLALPLASLKLLNATGIEPVLLKGECCCGHDAYWSGEEKDFEALVQRNLEDFKKAGVKEIITACPEGHYMFSRVYPAYAGDYKFEARHITEVVAGMLESGRLKFPPDKEGVETDVVCYHDSCKLGRFSEIYEAPRKIIRAIPHVEFHELERNRGSSSCCGVSGFINCNMNSKQWRQAKLKETVDVGAGCLLTGCPKCAIHLNCYLESEHIEPKFQVTVKPLIVKMAEAMGLMEKKAKVNDN